MNLLIFPNQLFLDHPGLELKPSRVVLIEDSLFFGDPNYPMKFHQQKLWLHRATMKRFEFMLQEKGHRTLYLDYDSEPESLKRHLKTVVETMTSSPKKLIVADPTDFMLEKRLERFCEQLGVACHQVPTPGFINQPIENYEYRAGKKRWFMADFYKFQRKRLDILMEGDQPLGGKWSFDADNRKKVPKKLLDSIPTLLELKRDSVDQEAKEYVEKTFGHNPGEVSQLYYPSSHADAKKWLKHFLKQRFDNFGVYEDAIVEGESWLWHSVLTPSLNVGLLTPQQVIKETLAFAKKNDVPLNSLEGFLRQIIGWREFIRATYGDHGVQMRTTNHWGHHRKIPPSFYDGTTGIPPIDDTIRRTLETGYCHHIERLMVLGGFMFLCEFDPDDIYRWFMEMFVDSYDWVMVPNAYAMSQHADGGLITTKPYFSGSSYIRKMSHHKVGPWCEIWDGLYWRWISNHADALKKNPRWAMMCSMAKKMDAEKLGNHLKNAETYLESLDRLTVGCG
ncbi:MAG: cryptochrome/photolyase family protein [Mariniblastus sp.]|nr:cryptochrome/photolyase family protein [Mariniblastus sp.]